MTPIFYIKQGGLGFADKTIFTNIEVYLYQGDKICFTGKNGSGKSSLIKIISGDYEIDKGEVFKIPNTTIGYLTQEMKIDLNISIDNFVLSNVKEKTVSHVQKEIIFKELGLDKEAILANCSGGTIRKANLAKVLIEDPDILLLDEPTNHLDITTIEWLENYLKNYKGALVCISHDRAFLSNISNKIWWIDRGDLRKSDLGFKFFDDWQDTIITQELANLQKLNKKLTLEQEWLNAGVTGRRKRNQGRLANLSKLRDQQKFTDAKAGEAKLRITASVESSTKKSQFILEALNLAYTIPGNANPIVNNFSIRIKKGEKIALIGANGSGKSTLIKLLIKMLEPDSGEIIHGVNLDITYFDQHRVELNADCSVQQLLCPSGGDQIFLQGRTMHVGAYLKQFMFDPKLLNAKLVTLSGGQANRLLLAKALIAPGNLLILDEPTNDLDTDSLEVLSSILTDYTGTLIIVSHDRDFLERLVTRTVVFAQDKIIDLIGGYNDYLAYLKSNDTKAAPKDKGQSKITVDEPKSTTNKLSYKYQRFLDSLPEEMAKLEQRKLAIEQKLSNNNLYLTNAKEFNSLTLELRNCENKMEEMMEQWMTIEDMLKNG